MKTCSELRLQLRSLSLILSMCVCILTLSHNIGLLPPHPKGNKIKLKKSQASTLVYCHNCKTQDVQELRYFKMCIY